MSEQLVIVTWEDTTNVAAWQTRGEMAEWAQAGGWICHNVGWVVHEDDECIVLAARQVEDEEKHVGLAERIPKRAVLSRQAIDAPEQGSPQVDMAEALARYFHETYESLAPEHGWETQPRSRKQWDEVPVENRSLMVAVAKEVLEHWFPVGP